MIKCTNQWKQRIRYNRKIERIDVMKQKNKKKKWIIIKRINLIKAKNNNNINE